MSIFIPIAYIFLGYLIGKYGKDLTRLTSCILINLLIPIVVFATIVTYEGNIFYIIAASFTFSILMYFMGNLFYRGNDNKILRLSFSYYNIGWLGLPIAIHLFGQEVSSLIIATYVGGMLYGSTFSIYILNKNSSKTSSISIQKLFLAPPFLMFLFALIFKFLFGVFTLNSLQNEWFLFCKTTMSIFGMALLGMWLQKTPLEKKYLIRYLSFSVKRLLSGFIVFAFLFGILVFLGLITKVDFHHLIILPLLPVAANIVVLETYYLKNVKSSQIIAVNTIFSIFVLIFFGLCIK